MKDLWKWILIGLAAIVAEWLFVDLICGIFNGLTQASAVAIGTGFFLAFEMVICTGVIVSNLKKNDPQK